MLPPKEQRELQLKTGVVTKDKLEATHPHERKKMADRAIKVAVLEGDFAAICDLGLPFSSFNLLI